MQASTLTSIALPLSLALIMIGMGMSLVTDDFRRVLRYPRAVSVGLVGQLLLLPLLAFGLVWLFVVSPLLAVGFMIIAACPGGVTSNLFSHLARGDVALSVTLTAVTSLVTVFTIPLVVNGALLAFGQEGAAFQLPVLKTILQVALITLLPVAIGMFIRARAPGFAQRSQGTVKVVSMLFLALLIVMIVLKEQAMIMANLSSLGPLVLGLNIATMALGWLIARGSGLDDRQAISIVIEVGIQNGTLAIVIATALLQNAAMAIPAVIYSLLMFATAGAVVGWRNWTARSAAAPAAGA